jgi:hypothetical protein
MKWPQIVLIVWIALEVGYAMAKHGNLREPPHHKHNAYTNIIAYVLFVLLLYAGGFWS